MGKKMIPWSTIRDRIAKKDLRFEREARQRAAQFDARPMTHEQRQELIRRPIVFNYYGGKGWGGCASQPSLIPMNTGGGVDTHFDGENND